MNITLTGIKIVQDNKFLAFEKNSGVDVINITVDTDDEWTYKLDVKYPDKCCSGEALYNIINLTRTGNVCTAILTSDMLPFAGKYTMQLRGINGDKVAHSDTFDAWVKYSIEPGSTYDPVPSEFYQIEENITEMNNNPPYPSDDGYWMIWDVNTRVYKKSDIKIINGLPEISESTKDMALYNDGEKAEWREQRNPIPDWQENDPESPNYIRNRNGGYYEQGEQFLNAVYPFNSFQIPVAYKNDDPVVCVNVNDTDGTKTFWKAFSYFCEKDNLETVGFYLRYTGPGDYSNEQYSYILKYNDGTKSVRMYDATPVIWSSDWLPELPVAGLNKLGVVSAGELEYDPDYYEDVYVRENGALFSPKYLIIINFFEYSESDGAKTNNRPGFYYESVSCGWILKSSNYLAEKLGITSTDFPIQIISEGNVYGSGVPYMNCVFSTRTGKTGGFTWRFNGSVLSSHLNDSSDLLIVRFTNNDGTWSADKTYAEMIQALDDGKTMQGVASDIAAIGYVSGNNIAFYFSLFYSENEQNRYFAYDAIDILVSEDGIKAFSNNDDLMGSYRRVILPAQTLLVTNNDGALSAVLMAQEQMENPLTYLFNAFNLLPKYTIPTLTALYDKKSNAALTERFYYSNAVATPNSDNTSAKVDFIFKSADATKTLTGSVTIPDGWDGYTPLDETWSYEEIAPFVFGCVTPPTPDGSVTSVTPLNDNYSKSLRAMIHILGGTTDDARAKSYSLFSAIVYTRGYECVCLSLTDFNIDPPGGIYTATFMGNVGKTRIARLSVTSRLTGIGVLDSSGYWETDGLDGAVRYDEAQSLTDAQKSQARDNIGALPVDAGVGQAEVGQILSVKSVDATGKPNSWNVVAKPKDGEKGDTGPSNVLTIGTVESGAQASATITGEPPNQTLNLVLPKGDAGATPNIQIGTVTTLDAGADATASMSGTPENPLLNLGIPKGADGGSDRSLGLTGATVGQIAKITAVDESGKPTAWNPVDMPGGGGVWTLVHEQVLTEPAESYTYALDNVRAAALVLFPNAAIDGGWKRVKINNLDVPLTNGKVEAQNGIAFAIDLDAPFKIFGTAQATGRLLATYGIVGSVITSLTADDITEINSIGVATSTLLIAGAKISIYVRE